MEPLLIITLGIVTLIGQFNNYGIDAERNPHLKDIRVRRQIEYQPYELRNKDKEATESPEDIYSLKTTLNDRKIEKREAFELINDYHPDNSFVERRNDQLANKFVKNIEKDANRLAKSATRHAETFKKDITKTHKFANSLPDFVLNVDPNKLNGFEKKTFRTEGTEETKIYKSRYGTNVYNTVVHVVQPPRDKSIITKTSPELNITIISNVPAHTELSNKTDNQEDTFDNVGETQRNGFDTNHKFGNNYNNKQGPGHASLDKNTYSTSANNINDRNSIENDNKNSNRYAKTLGDKNNHAPRHRDNDVSLTAGKENKLGVGEKVETNYNDTENRHTTLDNQDNSNLNNKANGQNAHTYSEKSGNVTIDGGYSSITSNSKTFTKNTENVNTNSLQYNPTVKPNSDKTNVDTDQRKYIITKNYKSSTQTTAKPHSRAHETSMGTNYKKVYVNPVTVRLTKSNNQRNFETNIYPTNTYSNSQNVNPTVLPYSKKYETSIETNQRKPYTNSVTPKPTYNYNKQEIFGNSFDELVKNVIRTVESKDNGLYTDKMNSNTRQSVFYPNSGYVTPNYGSSKNGLRSSGFGHGTSNNQQETSRHYQSSSGAWQPSPSSYHQSYKPYTNAGYHYAIPDTAPTQSVLVAEYHDRKKRSYNTNDYNIQRQQSKSDLIYSRSPYEIDDSDDSLIAINSNREYLTQKNDYNSYGIPRTEGNSGYSRRVNDPNSGIYRTHTYNSGLNGNNTQKKNFNSFVVHTPSSNSSRSPHNREYRTYNSSLNTPRHVYYSNNSNVYSYTPRNVYYSNNSNANSYIAHNTKVINLYNNNGHNYRPNYSSANVNYYYNPNYTNVNYFNSNIDYFNRNYTNVNYYYNPNYTNVNNFHPKFDYFNPNYTNVNYNYNPNYTNVNHFNPNYTNVNHFNPNYTNVNYFNVNVNYFNPNYTNVNYFNPNVTMLNNINDTSTNFNVNANATSVQYYSPFNYNATLTNTTLVEQNATDIVTTTTENISSARIMGGFHCPGFLQAITIMGKKLCVAPR